VDAPGVQQGKGMLYIAIDTYIKRAGIQRLMPKPNQVHVSHTGMINE
jgi:hypothetical protein